MHAAEEEGWTHPVQRALKSAIQFLFHVVCSCEMDTDDEVRDRATFYVNVLKQQQRSLSSAYILNG